MYGRTDVREITEVSGRTGEWGNGEGRETTEGRERTEGLEGQNGVETLRYGDGQMNGERKKVWKQQKVEGESCEEQQ